MSKKASIVMPFYNRLQHLHFTLKMLEQSTPVKADFEVVIVDDASDLDKRPSLIVDKFDLDINLIVINKEDKCWINPCHCFNIGFREAIGDVVIIQSPECFHLGNVIHTAIQRVTPNNYVLFPCKSITADTTERLWVKRDEPGMYNRLSDFVAPAIRGASSWYHHPTHNPTCYHFLSAINRNTLLEELGGFDERYARGCAFDDNEFIERIRRSPLEIVQLASLDCMGVHQWHLKVHTGNCKDPVWQNNWRLFINHTKKETGWRANQEDAKAGS